MSCIFIRKYGLILDLPVNAKRVVENGNAPICLGMIEFIAFVLEYGNLAQYGKAMGKALWDKELETQLTILATLW